MERTVFSAAQLEILDLMSYVESDDTLNEIKDMLSAYFARKAEIAIDKLWDSGKLNDQVIDQWKNEHITDSDEAGSVGYELPLDLLV